jgi:hypothetical protein
MNPEIWGNLPPDLIERIAHFADIDSRRALGFSPRKLVLPDLNIQFLQKSGPCSMVLRLENANMVLTYPCHRFDYNRGVITCPRIQWAFRFGGSFRYYDMYRDGFVETRIDGFESSRHPDFNEDGSFKRSRPLETK